MHKRVLPLSRVYRLIEPGPVVLLTTARKGRANVMPMSWLMMVEFEPPLIACIVSNRNYSFQALKATKECGISIPTVDLAATVIRCGNSSGRSVDKLTAFGLTPMPASCITPPLIAECYANLECRVVDTRNVTRYNLFVLEVLKAWHAPSVRTPQTIHHLGYGSFMVAGEQIRLRSKMP